MSTAVKPRIENHLDLNEERWFAVYTRYKREKIVKQNLQRKGIHCYLPLQQLTRHYTRKIKKVELPLISCYIFVKITKQDYVPVLEVPDVVNFIKFSNNLISIPEKEISIMRQVVGEGIAIQVEEGSFANGDLVEVIGGQLTGLKGTLIEQRNDKNFVVELQNLGYSLFMQIDPKYLRRIGRI